MRRGRRRHGAVFIDTNLLLVLIVGALDPNQIERFKRTNAYTREDYLLLTAFVGNFSKMLTTPNVLTEVSNLLGQLSEPLRRRALAALGVLSGTTHENYLPTATLAADPSFPVLGVADASILGSIDGHVTVLTDDFPLYQRLASTGAEVINFHHLRSGALT